MDKQPVLHKKQVHPQPTSKPTPVLEARFVVLGGPDAGIHAMTEHCDVHPAASRGACPPFSVLCRSSAEAEKIWQLQPMVRFIESGGKKDIAAAFMMNVVVRSLFLDDKTARFHTAFLGVFNRPVVYFSWADTYPALQRFSREGQLPCVQLTKTFLDALIVSCFGPPDNPSIKDALHYLRPRMPSHFPTLSKSSVPSRSKGPVIVISDDSESGDDIERSGDDGDVNANTTGKQAASTGRDPPSIIPDSVRELLRDPRYDQQFILVHARSVNGDVFRSHRCLSSEKELLPSFGVNTNQLLDALGYLPATIYRIHSTYLLARGIDNPNEAEKTFIREMGIHKLSLLEAALVWRSIMGNLPIKELYREREAMGTV